MPKKTLDDILYQGTGWKKHSSNSRETVLINQDKGMVITVRHGSAYTNNPVLLEQEGKSNRFFRSVPEAMQAVGRTMTNVQTRKQVISSMLQAGRPDLANYAATMITAGAKLSSSLKSKINRDLIKAGLDGNGRFLRVGDAISVAHGVFQKHGIEEDDVFSADRFRGPDGRATFNMAFTNVEDPFSPEQISNSMLVVQWHFFEETNRYEVLMYMS